MLGVVTGCASDMESAPFDYSIGDISTTDRIEVRKAGIQPLATITDSERVSAVVAFVSRQKEGWVDIRSGVAGDVVIEFYKGQESLDSVGFGPAGLNDGTYLKRLSTEDVEQLAALLGVSGWISRP